MYVFQFPSQKMWVDGCTHRREEYDKLLLPPATTPLPNPRLFPFRIDSGSTNLIDELVEHFGQRSAHSWPSSTEETTVKNHKH
jgi:hypothetical protein